MDGHSDKIIRGNCMNITYSRKAIKTIDSMDKNTKVKIRTAIENLPDGDTKQIRGGGIATHRLRVGGWRVLYNIDGDNIHIEKIAPRGQVYKGVIAL